MEFTDFWILVRQGGVDTQSVPGRLAVEVAGLVTSEVLIVDAEFDNGTGRLVVITSTHIIEGRTENSPMVGSAQPASGSHTTMSVSARSVSSIIALDANYVVFARESSSPDKITLTYTDGTGHTFPMGSSGWPG